MPAEVLIPDKDEFKIGEVCEIAGVKPFVLRYWETEFSELSPAKGSGGQRTYTRPDVQLILQIKHLLYEERFTVAGAKKRLAEERSGGAAVKTAPASPAPQLDSQPVDQVESLRRGVREVRRELEEILTLLK
jgi:DNA-binding transcriptional MerR regulator